jgi:hypothetical protein
MPLGTAFVRDIKRRPCTSLGVKTVIFLKEERRGLLKKHWNLVLEKRFKENLLLVSRWCRRPIILRTVQEYFWRA